MSEASIAAHHKDVQEIFAEGKRVLEDFKEDLPELSDKDLIASILYNDDFVIKSIKGVEHVLKRPMDVDPFVAIILSCIFIVGAIGSIEAILHKKYKTD